MAAFFDNGSMERGMVMQTYRGKSVFGGVAVGKICVYQKGEQTVKRTKIENTEQEKARFNAAVQESIRQLGELYEKAVKEVGEANAAIFEIHQIMLEDEDYLDAVQNIIDTQKVNAEYAVAVTGDNFAQMFAAMEYDASKNYKTVARMDAKLTMLDSINGDKQYPMDADVEMLQSGGTVNLKLTMDLSSLLEIPDALDGMDPLSAAALKNQLRNVKMEMIYDAEGGTLYLKMPLLAELSGGQLDRDSWIALPLGEFAQIPVGTSATMGAILYQSMRQQVELMSSFGPYFEGMITPALLYRELFVSAEEAAAYVGDDCFEASGGYSVLHYDEEDYNAYLESQYGEGSAEYLSEFEQLEMELKIARSGAATFRMLMQTKDHGVYSPAMLLDISGSQSPTRVDLSMLMKLKNQFNLELTYTGNTTETNQKPNAAPPAGETVVNPYDSYETPEPAAA